MITRKWIVPLLVLSFISLPYGIRAQVADTEPPVVTLIGDAQINVLLHQVYEDQGVTVTDNVDSNLTPIVEAPVDYNVPGTYTISYHAVDTAGNVSATVTRTIHVSSETSSGDTTNNPPVLTLIGDSIVTVPLHGTFDDPGVTVTDDHDVGLTATTSNNIDFNVPGDYTINYSATDLQGAVSNTLTRTIHVLAATSVGDVVVRQTGVHYTTIQAAIDAASPGDDIDVHAGTYMENILVDKSLQLHGGGAANTTIDGHGAGATIRLNADNVGIEGFTIMGAEGHGPNDLDAGIWSLADNANIRINSNTITDNAMGIYLICRDNCQINFNVIRDNNRQSRANPLTALYVVQSNNLTVEGNDISGQTNNNVFITFAEHGQNNLRFINNVIHDNAGSIFVTSVNNGTFSGNEIFGSQTTGINLMGGNQNVTISGNTIRDNVIGGVLVSKIETMDPNSNFTLANNTYLRNTQYNVCVQNGAYNGILASDPANCSNATTTENTAPTLTLNGSSTMEVLIHTPFVDPGVTVTDDHDVGLTATTTGSVNTDVLGSYTLSYSATDSQGAVSPTLSRMVNVVSTTTATSTQSLVITNSSASGALIFGIGGREGVGNAFFLQLLPGIPNTGGQVDLQAQIDALKAQIASLLEQLIILLQQQINTSA